MKEICTNSYWLYINGWSLTSWAFLAYMCGVPFLIGLLVGLRNKK